MSAWGSKRSTAASADSCASPPASRGAETQPPPHPQPAPEGDAYARDIQTADLNALNAVLAVIRWKRSIGIYADATDESHTTYSLITNVIANEDLP
ncbi:hypothetical protein ACH4F6_39270 [Streptomyces sp. NPDC017936]|uniref:hypothetical protein n=1 Tax=Streptomyces sp. NPDC017936 TaxID=3365016 RepID=UPI003796FC3B